MQFCTAADIHSTYIQPVYTSTLLLPLVEAKGGYPHVESIIYYCLDSMNIVTIL